MEGAIPYKFAKKIKILRYFFDCTIRTQASGCLKFSFETATFNRYSILYFNYYTIVFSVRTSLYLHEFPKNRKDDKGYDISRHYGRSYGRRQKQCRNDSHARAEYRKYSRADYNPFKAS